jgi:exopolysaccharide biosynthesis polyprenyl glycosylphosphotransferase
VEDVASTSTGVAERTRIATPRVGSALPSARRRYASLYRRMALTDALSVVAAMLIAYEVRFGIEIPEPEFLALSVAAPLFVVGMFALFHLYDAHHFTPAEEFRRIIVAVSVGVMGYATVSFWAKSSFSRGWIALSWGFTLVLTLFSRRLWHWYIRRARARGDLRFRTLIVGTNDEAAHLRDLMDGPTLGYTPIGFVATSDDIVSDAPGPVMGGVADLREVIRESGADCVFVASSALETHEMGHVAKAVRLEGVEVRVTATLPQVLSSRVTAQPLGGLMSLSLRPVRLTGTQAALKRAFDVTTSGFGLLLTAPLLVLIAVSIKLSSPGPVLFRQRRVGQRGRPFTILKFRTMSVDAEQKLDELRDLNEADGPLFKLKHDPRVTRIGGWLRRWSLDELPQLVNVLRGEMSMVGPRPPLPEEVSEYQDWQFDRLEVQPGVTGLWQVSGRSNLSFDEYVRLDLFYIENWSLAYDLFIVAKTIPQLVTRRGAY